MAHFAKLDSNNVVLEVIVISNEDVDAHGGDYHADAEAFVKSKWDAYAWKQCSYNNNGRKQFASVGYTYDADKNKFICPKPFDSWSLNDNDDWISPVGAAPRTGVAKLADDTDITVEDKRWDEDNQKFLGTWMPEELGIAKEELEWNSDNEEWDLI